MKILYHSDIIPELTMAFSMKSEDENISKLLEDLAIHRMHNLKCTSADTNATPIEQVGYTTQAYLNTHLDKFLNIKDISTAAYLPEHLVDENQRNLILQMCTNGRFIPLIMCIDMNVVKNCADSNIVHVLMGFGENPKYNFIMLTMNIPRIIEYLKIEHVEGSDIVHSIYPIIFDLQTGVIGSLLDKDMVSIRSFIMNTTNGEKVDNNESSGGTLGSGDN